MNSFGRLRARRVSDFIIFILLIFTFALHDTGTILALVQIVCGIIIYMIHLKDGKIKKSHMSYLLWLGGFIIIESISVGWAINTKYAIIAIRSTIEVLAVGFAVILYIDSYERIEKITNCVLISSLLLLFRLIIQVPQNAWGSERVGQYIGYGNNGAALVLSYATIFAFDKFQDSKEKTRYLYLLLSLLFIVVSFFCGSKKAVLITAIGIGSLMVLKSKTPLMVIKRLIQVIIFFFLIWFAIMNIPAIYEVLGKRIERMIFAFMGVTGGDSSTLDRLDFSTHAYKVFKNHFLLGVGIDNYRCYNPIGFYAHNNYLEIAADLGIVGLLWYYLYIVRFFFRLVNKSRRRKEYLLAMVVLSVILLMDVANVSYSLDSVQLYMAVIIGTSIWYDNNSKCNRNLKAYT